MNVKCVLNIVYGVCLISNVFSNNIMHIGINILSKTAVL